MPTYTNFGELLRLASVLGKAKKNGTKEEIEKAQVDHDYYKSLCLKADFMILKCTYGDLL